MTGTRANETFEQKIPDQLPTFKMVKIGGAQIVRDGKLIEVKPFWIGETEVTWDVYDIFCWRLDLSEEEKAKGVDAKSRPSRPYGAPDRGFGHAGFAALGMTSQCATVFCEWLSKKTGKKYRLPTEAEWLVAAQQNPESREESAWYDENAEGATHKVATKKANGNGLFDMFGNASEWAIDAAGEPIALGGNYLTKRNDIGVTARMKYEPKWQERDAQLPKSKWWLSDGPFIGMRLVCEE
jgi:formylglycine-generating enzyme required for sulfatase activity